MMRYLNLHQVTSLVVTIEQAEKEDTLIWIRHQPPNYWRLVQGQMMVESVVQDDD